MKLSDHNSIFQVRNPIKAKPMRNVALAFGMAFPAESIIDHDVVQVPACPIVCCVIDFAKEFELDDDGTVQFR